MSLMNNTSKKISYSNSETGHKFEVPAQTVDWGVDSQYMIPISATKDDCLPWYADQQTEKHCITITIGDSATFYLTEYQAHFYYLYDSDGTQVGKKIGLLSNGAKYVTRIDEVDTAYDHTRPSITIYDYKNTTKSTSGYIYNRVITELSANVVNVLLSIGPIT